MSTLVTRAGKGSPLTHNEVDANFTNLNTDKIQSGNTVAALTITALTTPSIKAADSAGLALKNSSGTTQMSMGAGGFDNLAINVPTNINGTNAQIDISPTGTGHVHIKPTGVNSVEIAPTYIGEMDNITIGATTAAAGSFTNLSVTGTTSFDGAEGTAGQVLTSAGSGNTPTWATPAGGGGISQVVSTTKTDTFTMSSTTYADITGLSVTITPSSSSSKILIMANVNHVGTVGTSASGIRLLRDSTPISIGDTAGSRTLTSGGESYGVVGVTLTGDAVMYLDSPATTSATTYKIQIQAYASTAYVNRSGVDADSYPYFRGTSSITVMEVKS